MFSRPVLYTIPSPALSNTILASCIILLGVIGLCKLLAWTMPQPGALADYARLSGVRLPRPLLDFNIKLAKARPYRPFRWDYHQTMALKKFEPDFWIELESTYFKLLKQRKELYHIHKDQILVALPGSAQACIELAEMVIQFLCARYPRQFSYNPSSGIFKNKLLVQEVDTSLWRANDAGESAGIAALEFLFDHIPEDFLVVQENENTGKYELVAGIACSALGWTILTKLGQPLDGIHRAVPDYKKLEFSMDRYFTKMECNQPIQRGAWGLEIGNLLFAPPGDPHLVQRESQSPSLKIDDISLRVDWQVLRRLPVSRAIAFNYKALFTPLVELREEPYIPRLLARILRDGNEELMKYKGTWHVEHVVLPALDKWAVEQEEKGWVPKDWKERTLDEDPFFPGWEITSLRL
ncbi:hypothetical protein H0H92_010657 [Tricholoma furcatifolium]|nr:hypothetical protein H0H92_010657 [Tricholoma furcatifolium]